MLALASLSAAPAYCPILEGPNAAERCPSKWGAGDTRGSANHMKPESVLKAARLIKTGEVIEIGQVLSAAMPFFGTRRFDVTTKRTFMNDGSNHRGSNEELVVAEMGQVGTQFDGFAHQTHEDSLYNCLKLDDIATRTGFTKLGIEKVGSLITRGVLIDVAALKGVEMLPDTYEITPADLQQALERQKLTLQPGDAVLIHTGWSKLWGKDNRALREDVSRASASPPRPGWPSRIRCSSAPTTGRSKSGPTPTHNCHYPCTSSCWS